MRMRSLLVLIAAVAATMGQGWQSGPATGFRYWRFDAEHFSGTGKVYFLGGRLSDGNTDGSVWSFDPVTQAYTDQGVDLAKPVSNYDICLLRDDYDLPAGDTYGLYIFGGRLGASPNNPTDTVQVYYPVSNRTRVLPSDPWPARLGGVPPVGAGAVVSGNKAYVFGGLNATAFTVTADAWLFDPLAAAGSKWTQLRSMTRGRAYRMAAVVDTFVYAMGGDTSYSSALYARAECERVNVLDTAAGWAPVASLPKVNGEARGFGFDTDSPYDFAGKVLIAGRGTWSSESSHCFLFNAGTGTWDTFPRLIQARRNHAGVFIPGTRGSQGVPGIWVFGGRQVTDTLVLRTAEFYQMHLVGVGEGSTEAGRRSLSLWPNPGRGTVRVRWAGSNPALLRVYDVTGKLTRSVAGRGGAVLSGLAAGTYLVRLQSSDAIEEARFVVAR